jgi:hypothetical protein
VEILLENVTIGQTFTATFLGKNFFTLSALPDTHKKVMRCDAPSLFRDDLPKFHVRIYLFELLRIFFPIPIAKIK